MLRLCLSLEIDGKQQRGGDGGCAIGLSFCNIVLTVVRLYVPCRNVCAERSFSSKLVCWGRYTGEHNGTRRNAMNGTGPNMPLVSLGCAWNSR